MTTLRDQPVAPSAARSHPRSGAALPPTVVIAVVVGWITTVLLLDSHGSHQLQRALGVLTWLVLFVVLMRESVLVRVQTAVVIVFASLVEFTFSPLLGVYVYRFDNVPMYVPPGHGLVYLAALSIGRTALVRNYSRAWSGAVLLIGGGWATYGVAVAQRTDALGAFWFVCLAAFFKWGPSRGVYIGAAIVVTYLELVGTSLGTWTWQTHDPSGLVPIGNPPSGAPGGYGWFDLAAISVSPWIIRLLNRRHQAAESLG
ncbi:MAG: hypothetical protein ACR2KG_09710 [Nocardioidaceae bacterium]